MHRDVKVGLSLGILLVGIVGALFLRREPEKKSDAPPQLRDAGQLDQQIAEKPHGPYILGPEEFAEGPAAPPAKSSASKPKATKESPQVPEFLTKEDGAQQKNFLDNRPAAAPDPIQTQPVTKAKSQESKAPAPVPAHNREWETAPLAASKNPKAAEAAGKADKKSEPNPQTPSSAPIVTHVIQAGDTLSGLAARYLGSSARYREIYEANQKVLRNPNDLPEGVTITIPKSSAGSTSKAASSKAEPKAADRVSISSERESPAATTEQGQDKVRFQPVHRTPFSAGRVPKNAPAPQPNKSSLFNKSPATGPSGPAKETALPRIDVEDASDLLDGENETSLGKRKGDTGMKGDKEMKR